MDLKVFITGGSGFLGKHLINRLQKENFELFGLARSKNSASILKRLNVKPIIGSLENISDWKNNLKDMDVIIHLAAPVDFWGKWEKYQVGIVDATKNIYLAAEEYHIKKFIFISSESVLQAKKDLIDIDENEIYPKQPNSFYGKSKLLAEKFILAQNGNLKSIIIRPTFIWGKGVKALDTIIEKVKSKDFMWINNGKSWFEMVHVDNVAESIFLAIKNGNEKEIYFVTDDNPQSVKSFLTKLIKTQGVIPPNKNIPKSLAIVIAGLMEFGWKTLSLKSDPMLTKFDVAFVAMGRKYNISKIKSHLNYKPIISEEKGLELLTK